MGPRGGPSSTILLNEHTVLKELLLSYCYRPVHLKHYQRSFSLHHTAMNTDSQLANVQKIRDAEVPHPKWKIHTIMPFPQGSGIIVEEGMKRL